MGDQKLIELNTYIQFGSEVGKVGEDLSVTISYVNPLPIPLTDLKITLEGPGLVAPTSGSIAGSVPPKGVASIEAMIVPSRAGLRKLIVDIDAKEQKDFKGEGEIFINP